MIKVIVNGALGKMGSESVKAIEKESDLACVGKTDAQDNLSDRIQSTGAEVVLDFTHPSVVKQNVVTILQENCHAVIGTTGLTETDFSEIHKLALERGKGLLVIPNFAIGAVLMMRFAAEAARYMSRVEIIEFHHDKKADAPSGTAIKTAELISKSAPQINAAPLQEKELVTGSRGGKIQKIPIHSVRLPGFVANQEVIFGGLGQTLTIRHDSISRESFMPGVILALRKVIGLKGLVYGMENILQV